MSSDRKKEIFKARSRVGVSSRRKNPEELDCARRDLACANIAAAVEKHLAAAPPLTDDQRSRLAGLFAGGASA